MKKEHILSDEEKKQKKIKIEENRVRKHQKQMNRKGNVNHNNTELDSSPRNNGSHSDSEEIQPGPSKIARLSSFHQLLVQQDEPENGSYHQQDGQSTSSLAFPLRASLEGFDNHTNSTPW